MCAANGPRARALVQTGDQGLSALINLTLTLLAARLGDLYGLGQLNLALTVYIALVGLQRAVVIECMLAARNSGALRGAQMLSLAMGAFMGLLIAAIGGLSSDAALVVLGLSAPALMLVDVFRYSAFSMRAPIRALVVDLVWWILLLASVLLDINSISLLVAWWAGSAAIAVAVGAVIARIGRWQRGDIRLLLREMRGRSPQGFVDTLLLQLGWYIPVAFTLDAIASEVAGEYRLAISLMAPMGVILTSWTTSSFVLIRESDGAKNVAAMRALYIFILSTIYAVLAVLFRDPLVTLLFGPSLMVTVAVMSFVALQNPAQAPGSQIAAWFKYRRESWTPVVARTVGTAVVLPSIWLSLTTRDALWCIAGIPAAMLFYSLTLSAVFMVKGRSRG